MLRSEWVNDNAKVNSNVQNCHLSCRAREVTDNRSARRQTNSVCPSASTKRTAEQNFIVYDLNQRNRKPLPYCETRPFNSIPSKIDCPIHEMSVSGIIYLLFLWLLLVFLRCEKVHGLQSQFSFRKLSKKDTHACTHCCKLTENTE